MRIELSGARVFITGAAGFLGANLTHALLERGAEVHAFVRPSTGLKRIAGVVDELQLHRGDLAQLEDVERALRAASPDVVFHLAAASGHPGSAPERAASLRDTVVGTANLLEAIDPHAPGRLVHVGSSLEHGHKREPIRETDALQPVTFRGAAKAAATMLVLQFALAGHRPVTLLRPFSVYGPWESDARFIPRAVLAALDDEELPLARGARRDFVFVEDVVEAALLAACARLRAGEIINVGSGRQTTNEEVVAALASATGIDVRIRQDDSERRPWDTDTWVADISKAKQLLGWSPAHTLEEGLRKTFEWFRSARAAIS